MNWFKRRSSSEDWWEHSIPVPKDYNARMASELASEVAAQEKTIADQHNEITELKEINAHLENMNTTLRNKIANLTTENRDLENWVADLREELRKFRDGELIPHSVVKERHDLNNYYAKVIEKEKRRKMENKDWKRVNYYAEHQASSLPDDIGYIEILIKGGCDEQTEKIILDSFPEFYADIWGCNPDKIYRVRSTGLPKPDIEDMQQVWPEKVADDVIVDYGDTSIKQLCKQIDKLIQENKNLSERISILNAELDMLEDAIENEQEYSAQLEKLIPKKKLKKLWKRQHKS